MVGRAGFEPAAARLSSVCSTPELPAPTLSGVRTPTARHESRSFRRFFQNEGT